MLLAQSRSARLALFIAISIAGMFLFWPAVYMVAYGVLHRHGSSHGVFIPLLSAYFIYLKWQRLKDLPARFCPPAAIATALFLAASFIAPRYLELQFIAYVFFIVSAVYLCFGKPIFKELLFPLLFSITMAPIPKHIYDAMADITRHITFSLALDVLSFFNIPFYRDDWLIKLPNALLEVARSCSGIRYLISYFVFGIAYAYLFREKARPRILIVAATIPISLVASTLRLTAIFLATYYISPRMAEYWPHIMLSWFVFFFILFGLIFLDQHYLNRKPPRKKCQQCVT
jgi:exosortase